MHVLGSKQILVKPTASGIGWIYCVHNSLHNFAVAPLFVEFIASFDFKVLATYSKLLVGSYYSATSSAGDSWVMTVNGVSKSIAKKGELVKFTCSQNNALNYLLVKIES